jgi:hypothetical protein
MSVVYQNNMLTRIETFKKKKKKKNRDSLLEPSLKTQTV